MVIDPCDSNLILEFGRNQTVTPNTEDVRRIRTDPELFLLRLDQISSPKDRLIELVKSTLNFRQVESTHEANLIRQVALIGGVGGFFFGALLKSPDIHADYVRRHNASVFEGKYRGNRHFWDTLIRGCSARGARYGLGSFLLSTSAISIAIGSITCRCKLYYPDWLAGFTALGAITRLWLGPRAMAVGAFLGAIAGTSGYGASKGFEYLTGKSVMEHKYLTHLDWAEKRYGKRREIQKAQEKEFHEKISELDGN